MLGRNFKNSRCNIMRCLDVKKSQFSGALPFLEEFWASEESTIQSR